MRVDSIDLRIIYNSRVDPTVEAVVNGTRAAAPSGASTGTHEALCFVPDDIDSIEQELRAELVGDEFSQQEFDQVLRDVDGTDSFAEIGAVAIACSLAFAKADGFSYGDTFPYPAGNLLGGGAHGGNTSIQEFLVIPHEAETIPGAMEALADIYEAFGEKYARRISGINDEGAYITDMDDEESMRAVADLAAEHGAALGVDMAASEFWDGDRYHYEAMGQDLSTKEQVKFVADLVDRFDLRYVEDPFHEDEFEALAELQERVHGCLVVGDDTFVTQAARLEKGIAIDAGNALIVKPNQAGTVSATKETFDLAMDAGYVPTISHRSGETCDATIADMAVAWGAPLLKAGIAGIRTAKNNQLLRLWDQEPGEMAELPF